MNELSLFSGGGGGVLGSKLLGWRTIGYVEWDKYCQQIIAQRIKDGIFDEAPIFTDVRIFAGIAREYRGFADVVTAGFPCQPFSVAGKRKAGDDERNMWPATLEVIKAVRPPIVFLENVQGLLSATMDDRSGRSFRYFGDILRDLAESGYDARWCVLGADDVGGIHRRKRLWVYAWYAKIEFCNVSEYKITKHKKEQEPEFGNADFKTNTNTRSKRGERNKQKTIQGQQGISWGENIRGIADLQGRPDIPEPLIRGMDDGVANGTNRLKAVGNGQVSLTMAAAYEILSNKNFKL